MTQVDNTETTVESGLRATEHTTAMSHGTELFYRAWLPAVPARKRSFFFTVAMNTPGAGRRRWLPWAWRTWLLLPGMHEVTAARRENAVPR
jgi:hypothetical protein